MPGTRREAVGLSTRRVWRKILISGLETEFYREIISGWTPAILSTQWTFAAGPVYA